MRVIDSDAHFAEPADLWSAQGMPLEGAGWNAVTVQGRRIPAAQWDHPVDTESYARGLGRVQQDAFVSGYDPASYLRAFDREEITAAVLFPTRGLALLSDRRTDRWLMDEAAIAFDIWAHTFCAQGESRLFGVGLLPLIDSAVAHAETIAHYGLVAAVTVPRPGLPMDAPSLEPLYAALERLDLPLVLHTGAGAPLSYGSGEPTYLRAHALVHPFTMMHALMEIVVGGVLHRHPKLRVGLFEAGAWWLPGWLERLDGHALGHFGAQHYDLPRLPSQYVKDGNVFVTLDAGEPIGALIDAGLEKCLLFASDFPHGDSVWPYSRGLSEEAAGAWWKQISETNPRRLYRLKESS